MKTFIITLLYANRAEHKSISVISIPQLTAALGITKLYCMHRECYILLRKIFALTLNSSFLEHNPIKYIIYYIYIIYNYYIIYYNNIYICGLIFFGLIDLFCLFVFFCFLTALL